MECHFPECMVRRSTAREIVGRNTVCANVFGLLVGDCSPGHDDDPLVPVHITPTVNYRHILGSDSPARRLTVLSSCPLLIRLDRNDSTLFLATLLRLPHLRESPALWPAPPKRCVPVCWRRRQPLCCGAPAVRADTPTVQVARYRT